MLDKLYAKKTIPHALWTGIMVLVLLLACGGHISASEFIHPGVGVTKTQLDVMKAGYEQGKEPWKSWHDNMVWARNYGMHGPFSVVTRNGDLHRNEWESDMRAVSQLGYLWYMEQDSDPVGAKLAADRGIAILEAWATTQTVGGGIEWSFEQGDYIGAIIAADILKATYPGWTTTNTAHIQWYFGDFWWKSLRIGSTNGPLDAGNGYTWERGGGANAWSANQGMLTVKAALASAIFCDDRIRFNETLNAFLTSPDCGLLNTAPNGQMGDTGRDNGHAGTQYEAYIACADMFWSQGVDVYSAYDNRLRTVTEYLAQRELYGLGQVANNVPFVNFGCEYGYWTSLPAFDGAIRMAAQIDMARQVYKARGLLMPYADQLVSYAAPWQWRSIDTTRTVTPPSMWTEPTTTTATSASSLTAASLGWVRSGSTSVNNGIWTLSTNGVTATPPNGPEKGYQFAYTPLSGDGTLIAQVTSGQGFLIMTDRLQATPAAVQGRIELRDGSIICMWRGGGHSSYAWPTWRGYYDNSFTTPYWLKLVRRGSFITQYASPDGINWTSLVNILYPPGSLPNTMYAGLACDTGTTTFANVYFGSAPSSLPRCPQTIQAVPQSSSSVLLTWTPSPSGDNCVFYDILRYDDKGNRWWMATHVTGNSFVDKWASSGTIYSYQIGAGGFSGRNIDSPWAAVGVAPGNLTATGGDGSVTLSWSNPSGTTNSYRVKRSESSGGPYTTIATTTNATYTDTGLVNSAVYYYVVSGVTNDFESLNSAEVVGLPATATGIWAANPQSDIWSLNTNWVGNAVPGNGLDLIFNTSAITMLTNDRTNFSPGNLFFSPSANAFTISGNPWLFNGMLLNSSSQRQTFSTPITLTKNNVINAYAGDIALSGVIAGKYSLSKTGTRCLLLNSTNTFTGGMAIKAGAVNIGDSQGCGSGTVTLDGGMLGNTADVTINNPISILSSGTIALGSLFNFTITSPLTGSGSLTLGGNNNGISANHSLYLANTANTFSGTITMVPSDTYIRFANAMAGSKSATWAFNGWNGHTTLDFSNGTILFGAFTGSGQISANGPGSRTISVGAKGSDDTFSGMITDGDGTVSVTKTGTGTQTFSGAHTYSGMTTVNSGTLRITGSLASPVTVMSGGQLAGSGTIAGTVNVSSGGIMSPGAGSTIATLTLTNGLTLAKDSVLNIGMGASTDVIVLSGGTYTPPASGTTRVDLTGIQSCPAGSYPLMTGATGININQFALGLVPKGYRASLSATDGTLLLTLSTPLAPTGLSGTPVNTGISLHWTAPDDSATSYTIYRADTPNSIFTAIATTSTADYTDTTATLRLPYTYAISASNKCGEGTKSNSVTITPTQSVLWYPSATTGSWNTGANWISGSIPTDGQTVIFGPSSIVSALTNDCSDGLSLSGIAFASDAAAYTITGKALSLTGTILGYSAANQVLAMPMTLSGSCTANIKTASVALNGVLSGSGSLLKTGEATLIVNGANTFTGNTVIQAGALNVGNNTALGSGNITLSGGRIGNSADVTIGNPIIISSSGSITLGAFANCTITSPLSGSGLLTLGGNNGISSNHSLYLRGSASGFSGTATVVPSDTYVRFVTPASGSTDATWIFNGISDHTTLDFADGTIDFGSFSGSGYLQGNNGTGTKTLSVGTKGLADVFSGVIANGSGTLALTKVGSGSLLLSGANVYSGPTKIDAGTMIVTGSIANTSSVTVTTGAIVSGTGILGGTTSLQTGGTIAPGTSDINGTLTLKGLALSADSTLAFTLDTVSDALTAGGTYMAPTGGTAMITVTLGNGATVGSYTLIRNAPDISASQFVLGTLPRGYTGTLSAANGNLVLDLALITIPSGLVATPGNEHVSLAWTPVSGALSYTVRRAASDGVFTILADQLTNPAYVDASGVIDTTYTYTVSATTAAGESLDSNSASAAPYGIPIPTGLVAIPGDGRVDLAWSEATGAVNYRVYRSMTSGSGYTVLASNVTTATFTDTTCTNDITYFYTVSAVTAHGEGVRSSEVSAMPKATVVIAVPTGLTAKAGDAQVKLTWSATANATGYTVWRATVSGGPYAVLGNTSDVTLTDTTCVNGTTYYYAVSAVFSVGAGLRSAEVSATPVAPITLPSPTNLSAIAGDGQVRLAWLKTVGATSYTIWRSTTHGGPYAQLANLVSNSFFTDTTCRNGLTYFYVVSAVYAAGESTQSAEISAAPQAIPGNVVATAGDARVDVAWSMVLNVTGYTVWRATALDGPYATMATGITATTWSDTTCENGTTYYYAVSADSGSRSQGVAATPIAVLHTVPTGVTAIAGDAHVDLAWVAADGATGYTIRRATVSGGPYSALIENLAATEFTDTTCKNGTTYYYIVSATGSGDGDHSAEVSARPDLPMKEPTSLACGFGGLFSLLLAFTLLLWQRIRLN